MVVLIGGRFGIGEVISLFVLLTFLVLKLFSLPVAIAIIIFPIVATYLKLRKINLFWHDRGVPGPIGNILFGSKMALFSDVNGFDGKNFAKYGDTYGTVLTGVPDIATKDVDFIKTVLNAEFDAFTDREEIGNFFPSESLYSSWVTILKGDDWKRVRQRLTPAFTTAKMRKLLVPMEYCAMELVNEIEKNAKNENEVDIKDVFGKLTMNVIGRAAFALNFNTFNQKSEHPFVFYAKKMFKATLIDPAFIFVMFFPNIDALMRLVLGWKTTVLRDTHDFFYDTVSAIVDQRISDFENAKGNVDALQLMLNAMESDKDVTNVGQEDSEFVSESVQHAKIQHNKVTRKEVIAQMTLFLAAGYETTANTLHFSVYCMAHHPEVQQKARAEIQSIIGDKEHLDFDDMLQLVYVKQVIYETLRMFAPAPRVSRTCNRPISIHGIDFEPGNTFTAQVWHVHYDERNYPEPNKFDPERFSPEMKAQRDTGAFLPFGGGPRTCIGMRFAEYEMLMALAHLLKKYEFLPSLEHPFEWPIPIKSTGLTTPVKVLTCRAVLLKP